MWILVCRFPSPTSSSRTARVSVMGSPESRRRRRSKSRPRPFEFRCPRRPRGGAPPCLSDKRLTGCGSLRTSPLAMSCEERFAYRGLHRTSSRPGRRPSGSISARSATRQIGIRMSARTGSVRERFVSDGADSRDVDSSAARDESSRRGTDSGSNDRRVPRRSPRRASDSRRTPDSGSVRSRTAIRPLAHLRRFRDSLRASSLIDLRTHACRAATCFERTVPASADI